MPHDALNILIDSLESSGYEMFREYEGQFFMLFYDRFKNIPFTESPDTAFMFMEINNWHGMSFRCVEIVFTDRAIPMTEQSISL